MTQNDCQAIKPASLKKRAARAFFWYAIDISIALVGFTYGFGLEVKNWPALLGTFIVARFLTHVLSISFARDDAMALATTQSTAAIGDQLLFLTHTPDGFPVGSVRNGCKITRLERVGPTALADGGVAPCWQVYGVETPSFNHDSVWRNTMGGK